jgi:hypothetical protein
MLIREVRIEDVVAGCNWRLKNDGDASPNMIDWEIEECSEIGAGDTVVYSALVIFETGEARPLLMIREVETYDWWGDTCEYVNGSWRELGQTDNWVGECYVAEPLLDDPSFMGEYSHEKQRAGFAQWRDRLPTR